MGRRCDLQEVETLVETIKANPMCTKAHLAQRLGWPYRKVERRLISAELAGYTLYEDDKARLGYLEVD